jgi:hypothetical protein
VVRRAVEVYAQRPGEGGWTSGSGYLLAARLVLTAAHVIRPDQQVLSVVKVRAQSGALAEARVVNRPGFARGWGSGHLAPLGDGVSIHDFAFYGRHVVD